MYFQAQKPLNAAVILWHRGPKILWTEKSKQHFKLAHGYFHCQKLKPISNMNWNQLHHWFWHFPYQFCRITKITRMSQEPKIIQVKLTLRILIKDRTYFWLGTSMKSISHFSDSIQTQKYFFFQKSTLWRIWGGGGSGPIVLIAKKTLLPTSLHATLSWQEEESLFVLQVISPASSRWVSWEWKILLRSY